MRWTASWHWLLGLLFGTSAVSAAEAVWQWSVPVGEGRAFLWIPEDCRHVRAVVVGQHNMIEQGILEHAVMRRTLAGLGLAEVFIAPPFDRVFDFNHDAGERFDAMMRALAAESGYAGLAAAPVVPIGHSACASFPWNFAAWNPGRTLAILSVKGDAPQTNLTGSGAPNPDWGPRRLDGIPGLMVMSEAEWWEARLAPLVDFRAAHPAVPLAVLADTGHGHFDATDRLVGFLALFIRKAAEARLPSAQSELAMLPVDPAQGWLAPRWRGGAPPSATAARFADYQGDRTEAFWCIDEEMARATEAYQAVGRGRRIQQVDFVQAGAFAPISTAHAGVELQFLPEADGATFRLSADFIAPLPPKAPVAAKDKPPPPMTYLPTPAVPGTHAAGTVAVTVITGPAEPVAPGLFRVTGNRTLATTDKRDHEIWLLASHAGDSTFKGAVQQARLRLPECTTGRPQTIAFAPIDDLSASTPQVLLQATSSVGLPVEFYVREGPAFITDGGLRITPVPPGARRPVKITVVAWQPGRAGADPVQAALPVVRSFWLK